MNLVIKEKLAELDSLIDSSQADWTSRNKWFDPDLADGCDFVVTEVGELRRAFYGYTSTPSEIATEAFDVYMMARTVGRVSGARVNCLSIPPCDPEVYLTGMIRVVFDLIEARLRLSNQYTRNNPIPGDIDRLSYHLSEIATLAVYFVTSIGLDFDEVGRLKLLEMEDKRK